MSGAAIPAHVSTEAGPADRGRAFGAAQAGLVANTVAAYRRLFAATQNLSPGQIEQVRPDSPTRQPRWPRSCSAPARWT
jgi:hypothetical protein